MVVELFFVHFFPKRDFVHCIEVCLRLLAVRSGQVSMNVQKYAGIHFTSKERKKIVKVGGNVPSVAPNSEPSILKRCAVIPKLATQKLETTFL
jgi:hypothetical protein